MSVNELRKSAVEINAIFENLPTDILEKIPSTVKVFFKQIASDTYSFKYDTSKRLNEQNLMPKTKGVLALIYRDYICTKEERLEYIQKYNSFLENRQNMKQSITQENIEKPANTDLPIALEKENWCTKLFNSIKKLFKK